MKRAEPQFLTALPALVARPARPSSAPLAAATQTSINALWVFVAILSAVRQSSVPSTPVPRRASPPAATVLTLLTSLCGRLPSATQLASMITQTLAL